MTTNHGVTHFAGALEPGTRVGRWRVVEALGVGGQGAVYRVEDTEHPGDFHALKLALYARDGRAEREVELMRSRAAHPHVVGFHGSARWPDSEEGRLGFVMEWVPGQALDVWAEKEDTTFRQLAGVCATVARTLGELHARGVLHRDLKPEHMKAQGPCIPTACEHIRDGVGSSALGLEHLDAPVTASRRGGQGLHLEHAARFLSFDPQADLPRLLVLGAFDQLDLVALDV